MGNGKACEEFKHRLTAHILEQAMGYGLSDREMLDVVDATKRELIRVIMDYELNK